MSAMARDTARNSFDWICSGMDTKRPCSLGIDAIRDSSAESWLMGPGAGWPVKYCLSERADPTCKLHFEPTIGTIVTILNFGKFSFGRKMLIRRRAAYGAANECK